MDDLALIIEDDEDLSIIFAEAVRNAGYQVEMIRDGQSAQQRLAEAVPDLIILDMHLPHVSGPDLFDQIQKDKRLRDCIIVIATADARMGDAYTTKADFVLIKPISYVQLRDLTARLKNEEEDDFE